MPKQRAYGAVARLLAARETTYGVLPPAGWRSDGSAPEASTVADAPRLVTSSA